MSRLWGIGHSPEPAGGTLSTAGFALNLALDISEGDLEAAATRASIELGSMGMGSMVKNPGQAEHLNGWLNRLKNHFKELSDENKTNIECNE